MPTVGARCHELRITDGDKTWRIIHRLDPDAIVILEVFSKSTKKTPDRVIKACQLRLERFEADRHS
jgi:phage-related protein